MSSQKSSKKFTKPPVSELRRDLVTGNWIVVAKGREKRPHAHKKEHTEDDPVETCPFEDPQESGNEDPVLIYYTQKAKGGLTPYGGVRPPTDKAEWSLQVIPNKYPAFATPASPAKRGGQAGGECGIISKVGPYSVQDGKGFHEVIITRDHTKHLALMPRDMAEEVFRAYKERYLSLKYEECVKYISIFHNHGREAGASLTHPHSQLVAIPILPSDIRRSLSGSSIFYRKQGQCVHCAMLDWEREDKRRIVFQNKDFIAICPFVSRDAYEVRIFPQKHSAYFEEITDPDLLSLTEVFQESLQRLYKKLDNPSYNFYLHTAPVDGRSFDQYHWHFEITPKTETAAGFEFSTGVEIATVEPERAAAILRS